MTIRHVFFDIGGVLGCNGWDHEQRMQAVERFGLDEHDFGYRHQETVGALEEGRMTLDEYLDITVFDRERPFARNDFIDFMYAQSQPWPDSIEVVRALHDAGHAELMTLNNESEELNRYRIARFGLEPLFDAFLSSCWLSARKPAQLIYRRALGIAQADPAQSVFIDDREQNLTPARALGMQTILFQNAAQLRSDLAALGVL